ncbi:hypothetical protein FRX31_004441 [Thalictrum thalictroides]|uniref:Pentatricopeptide repeat-containing protein n=1 Tax=Thalictrum thalictroides TaxID=46969 RepID=A0A7J6XC59_THATH|nr:hypothetical protein FRX31_004441 [Thalictrum thalictroides]
MVSLLGKVGRLDDALDLMDGMPHTKDNFILTSLLQGFTMNGNLSLGLRLVEELRTQYPDDLASYIFCQ